MKTLEELNTFIDHQLLDELKKMEDRQILIRNSMRWMWITCLFPFCIWGFFVISHFAIAEEELNTYEHPEYWKLFGIAGMILVVTITCYLVRYYMRNRLEEEDLVETPVNVKEVFVKPIVSFLNSHYTYQPWNHISSEMFLENHLFADKSYRITGSNLIYGISGEAQFQYCNLKVGLDSMPDNIFAGSYFIAQFPAVFQSSVYILSKDVKITDQLFENEYIDTWSLGRKVLPNNKHFNRLFVVYTKDSMVALNLLSDDLIELLCVMQQRTKYRFLLAFHENKLSFGIDNNCNHFEMLEEEKVNVRALLEQFYVEFNELLQFTAVLSKNVDIWSRVELEI
ncbi:DUF3137 domain-containing protein [Chitinophaga silvatica]|uniref:DUF3137 domain-containing protein n=1 Tax=Chitinophaga silvatica TaxID=2282649 RepID=A0A3E1YEN5_9BACT|nr:DUF3137 domain-containing protein [Chitinophaga silvatica]RFS25020.1 DUF3137 domain-containing protein [Chitinophaga silvatica]